MRIKILLCVVAVVVCLNLIPSYAFAAPSPSTPSLILARPAAAGQCTDVKFLQTAATDLKTALDLISKMQFVLADLIKTETTIADLRHKYEDMADVVPSCVLAKFSMITAFANMNELPAIIVAALTDRKNVKSYQTMLNTQLNRATNLSDPLGNAVLVSVGAPVGGICTDTKFLATLSTDFKTVSGITANLDTATNLTMIKSEMDDATLRHKYEDLAKIDPKCVGLKFAFIVYSANAEDLLSLYRASLSDPTNADTYQTSITDQTDRLTKLADPLNAGLSGITGTAAAPTQAATP